MTNDAVTPVRRHAGSLVSVIIPTYNRPEYVRKAVESVMAQTFQDWELILVDDGSIDGTNEVLQSYVRQDRRIRALRQANGGTAAARNAGLREASGRYAAFLDDDDEWLPQMLAVEVAFMESHPEIGLCYSRLQILREVNGKIDDSTVFPKVMGTGFPDLLTRCLIMPSTAIIRRSCLTEVGGFDPAYALQDDFDLWLRFVQRFKIAALDRVLARTKKDGRFQESHRLAGSLKSAIHVVSNLKLLPDFERYERLRMRHIGKLYYTLGREHFVTREFLSAARCFARGLWGDPFVALKFMHPGQGGVRRIWQIAKSYAAVPICLILGIARAGR